MKAIYKFKTLSNVLIFVYFSQTSVARTWRVIAVSFVRAPNPWPTATTTSTNQASGSSSPSPSSTSRPTWRTGPATIVTSRFSSGETWWVLAVADPGFPRPAAPTAEFGEKLLFSKMFDENYMKMKETGQVGRGDLSMVRVHLHLHLVELLRLRLRGRLRFSSVEWIGIIKHLLTSPILQYKKS